MNFDKKMRFLYVHKQKFIFLQDWPADIVRLRRRKLFLILLAKLDPDLPPSEFRLSSLLVATVPLLGLNHVAIFSDSLPEIRQIQTIASIFLAVDLKKETSILIITTTTNSNTLCVNNNIIL